MYLRNCRSASLRRSARAVLGSVAVFALVLVPLRAWALDVEAAAAKVRSASGIDALREVCTLSGESTFMGAKGRFKLSFDRDGRCVEDIVSPVAQTNGFDGTTAWEVDWNGIPRHLDLADRDEILLRLWFATGQWLLSPKGLTVAAGNDTTDFQIRMDSHGLAAGIRLDETSGLPAALFYNRSAVDVAVTLGDYRREHGIALPHRIELHTTEGMDMVFVVDNVSYSDEHDFATVRTGEGQATFDDAVSPSLEIKVAPTKHLMVQTSINGGEPMWFIFDSGAGETVISTSVADSLGLSRIGTTPIMGVGGTVEGSIYKAQSLTLGPATLDGPILIGFDLSPFEPFFGVKLAGIVGYGLLSRVVAEYDIRTPSISLFNPATYRLEGASWQPLSLYSRTAHVTAVFEDHAGEFLLDTGAANKSLAIYAPAVDELGLLEDRDTESAQVVGGGGALPARKGKVAWVEVGGRRFENVETFFATERSGVYSDTYVMGSFGGILLQDFLLVFDYSHARIAFVPRAGD